MTKPIGEFKPYAILKDEKTVYEERFVRKRIVDLHWSCVAGGMTGYQPADIKIEQKQCDLSTNHKDVYTVCEFVQAGQMEQVDDFTLTLSGKIKRGTEKFGLFWDYSHPTIFSEDHALWLKPKEGRDFSFRLIADWKNKKARMYLGDEYICERPYETKGGLFFILKNADVTIKHIQVRKGIQLTNESQISI